MTKQRIIVHYYFKKDLEKQGKEYLEKNFFTKAIQAGCQDVGLLQDSENPYHYIATGVWNNVEDAKKFQPIWEEKRQELSNLCSQPIKLEVFTLSEQAKNRWAA